MSQSLYEKLFEAHLIGYRTDQQAVLYIDRHLIHEVTSPQAFSGMKSKDRTLWRKASIMAMTDHNVPTRSREKESIIENELSRIQVDTLQKNCDDHHIPLFDLYHPNQGIVHVVSPELGNTQPGMTLVCGDSHTSTHGAFGVLAMGIGTSMVEHVLSTQTIITEKLKTLLVKFNGNLQQGVEAKDMILHLIRTISAGGGIGYAMELQGEVIDNMDMEQRMTLCNMGVEAGARVTLIGVDRTTIEYLADKPYAPKEQYKKLAQSYWSEWKSDVDAVFDKTIELDISILSPCITWGTSPDQVISVDELLPDYDVAKSDNERESMKNAYQYMGLEPNTHPKDIAIDRIFIGSCTNSRISDLRAVANVVRNRSVAKSVKRAMIVPGSTSVKKLAEAEGLDDIFKRAGFEWLESGCSMCLGMNDDKLEAGERCASTSNRNFEGRQGAGGLTHLVSPTTAAAAAISGVLSDPRDYL